jgi:hypothetical protein
VVRAVAFAALLVGCTASTARPARQIGMVAAIGGVIGLTATSAAAFATDDVRPFMATSSIISALGIALYAAGELTDPRGPREETTREKHTRWAQILTERSFGYARDARCRRVRHIERRVLVYDRAVHDGVFMRDPEILRCMEHAPDLPPDPEASLP